jgi:cytidylate kinase
MIITIDGPAGAGKSTVSKRLAERLGYDYLDTGAIYRAIAYRADQEGLTDATDDQLRDLCARTIIDSKTSERKIKTFANGVDITDAIRTPEISMLASRMSALPAIRAGLLILQRRMAQQGGIVAEGRDMGTVVFPQADVKFFLDAEVDERVRRRFAELVQMGLGNSWDAVREDMLKRDRQDREREIAPLRPAPDAICIDSTQLDVEGVIKLMMQHIRDRSFYDGSGGAR